MRLNQSRVFAFALCVVAAAWAATARAATVGTPDSQGISNPVRPATFAAAAPDRRPTAGTPDDPSPAAPSGEEVRSRNPIGTADEPSAGGSLLRVGADFEPPAFRGPAVAVDDLIRLHEVAGDAVTVRVTPIDDSGNPVDGGRVIVLRPGERRTVHLAESLPIRDLTGRRLVIETLSGSGTVEIAASWLTPDERAAAATTARVVRRHVIPETPPTTDDLIDQAESSGALDHETAVLYRVYAIFGDARLPAAYRGDDTAVFESLYLSTVVSEFPTYSAATQTALQPFLAPPVYRGSWATPATLRGIAAFDTVPICDPSHISTFWGFKENDGGKVRIWYDLASDDSAVAAFLATTADTTIWPTFAGFMGTNVPKDDSLTLCSGGSGRLDVYLTDIARSYTQGHLGCSNTPAYIVMNRARDVTTLAHEMFHAFQYSFEIGGCLTDDRYRWWTEGSATWAEQYIYPNDWKALAAGTFIVNFPERSLESVVGNNDRVYGTFLLPFYVQNNTGSADFVRTGWENCKTQDAIHAVDAVIPGGFAQTWHEVALHDWNAKPHDEYSHWRSLLTYHPSPQANLTVDAGMQPDSEISLFMNLAHLSATYKNFFFYGPEISSVAFFNGATFNLQKTDAPGYGPLWNPQAADTDKTKGVKVQAVIKIEGKDPTVEDWTDKPYVTFCRDTIAERLQQLTIIISNARLDDSGGNAVPPGMKPVVWLSNMGCYKWKGNVHYSAAGNVTGSEVADTTDVVWTRTSATHAPPEVLYQASGLLDLTAGNQCAGSGTVAITSAATSLTTYNFTPAEALARRAYVGASVEFNSIPVTCLGKPGRMMGGFWFNVPVAAPPNPPPYVVSPDGKRLSNHFQDSTGGLQWDWTLISQRE